MQSTLSLHQRNSKRCVRPGRCTSTTSRTDRGRIPRQNLFDAGVDKQIDLLAVLLAKMSEALGYDFDETYVKRAAYLPMAHGQVLTDQDAIRRDVAEIMQGRRSVPIVVVAQATSESPLAPVDSPPPLLPGA